MTPDLKHRAEMVVQAVLGTDPTPAGIVFALDHAGLMTAGRDADGSDNELTRLRAELEDERAAHAKTIDNFEAAMGLAEGETLTAWRLERGGIPLGTYLSLDAAQRHGETDHAEQHGPARTGSEALWLCDAHLVGDVPLELCYFGPGPCDEAETSYVVVPVPLQVAYDPEADK
ncbi:hypothetical protein BX265_5007 [Streptomyces sp. TLI_235]|nr:hypothetical protein [Streptomyces sp. TLI_235]PBC72217.1 hypothetical protein BX265_6839 [Streptomyces sp. TLI_235]PBC80170.1 hypothetical protein BX265_5007 [Streptomyces sp. TLI_235]